MEIQKERGNAGGKIDSNGTDRPETSGRFTEAERLSFFVNMIKKSFTKCHWFDGNACC